MECSSLCTLFIYTQFLVVFSHWGDALTLKKNVTTIKESLPGVRHPSRFPVPSELSSYILSRRRAVATQGGSNYGTLPKQSTEYTSCTEILSHLKRNTLLWKSSTLQAFNIIYNTLEAHHEPTLDDKPIFYALNIIQSYYHLPHVSMISSSTFLHLLTSCVIGKEQRSLIMELVYRGMLQALEHPLCVQMMSQASIVLKKDALLNNIIHLAVMSRNLYVYNYVIGRLPIRNPRTYLDLIECQNQEGHSPLSIAVSTRTLDIADSLRAHHWVYTLLTNNEYFEDAYQQLLLSYNASIEPSYPVIWNSPSIAALRVAVYSLTQGKHDNKDLDKTVTRALSVVSLPISTPMAATLLHQMNALRSCSLDRQGNTLLMLCIRLGLVDSLSKTSGFLSTQWESIRFLRDTDDNNALHSAVLSQNLHVVHMVIDHLQSILLPQRVLTTNNAKPLLLNLLEKANKNHETPVQLARNMKLLEITDTLQAHYTVYNTNAKQFLDEMCQSRPRLVDTCCFILSHLNRVHRISDTPVVTAFRAMGAVLINPEQTEPSATDKLVVNSLKVIVANTASRVESLQYNSQILKLKDCTWTEEKQNLLMMVVKYGLLDTLNSPNFHLLKGETPLGSLVDYKNQNLIHLAILSNNAHVVTHVLGLLSVEGSDMLQLLMQKNTDGLTPRDMALHHRSTLIVDVLNAHFTTYRLHSAS